jgi:opacity protein-like surface antigen
MGVLLPGYRFRSSGYLLAFPVATAYILRNIWRRFSMSVFDSRSALALALTALWLGGPPARAQDAGIAYSSWPVGFYSDVTVGQSANTFGSLAGFDGRDARGFSRSRIDFPNGWFVGGATGPADFTVSGINRTSAFGGALYSEGMQFGYKFQNGLPLTVFAGFDTLKTNSGLGNPLAPFDSASSTLPGYRARAGVEFQPAPNLSLSLGVGYTQAPQLDGALNSFGLPGAAPFGRR